MKQEAQAVSRETVAGETLAPAGGTLAAPGETTAPSAADIERALIEQAMPLPAPGPRNRHAFWNQDRLLRLRDLVLTGRRDEFIARVMSTPEWPLTATTIRVRLSRLGWVVRRPRKAALKARAKKRRG